MSEPVPTPEALATATAAGYRQGFAEGAQRAEEHARRARIEALDEVSTAAQAELARVLVLFRDKYRGLVDVEYFHGQAEPAPGDPAHLLTFGGEGR